MAKLKVYMYCLMDEDNLTHSGLTANTKKGLVLEDIRHNYRAPRHIMVMEVSDMAAVEEPNGQVHIAAGARL